MTVFVDVNLVSTTLSAFALTIALLPGCANVLGLNDDAHLDEGGAGGRGGSTQTSTTAGPVPPMAGSPSSTSSGVPMAGSSTSSGEPFSCKSTSDCDQGDYCDALTCQPKKMPNTPCLGDDECKSGQCKGFTCKP